MKAYILNLFFIFLLVRGYAQTTDSIKVSNATLFFTIHGKGQKILLLSGGPGLPSSSLAALDEQLSKRYSSILFDQRGTGKSYTKPFDSTTINLNQAAEDINLLRKKLGVSKIIIVGHSWGAMLALYYATKFSEQTEKLILIDPGPLSIEMYPIIEETVMSRTSADEKTIMKTIEDSMAADKLSMEQKATMAKIDTRLKLYDARKADSILTLMRNGGKGNDVMGDLIMQDLFKTNYDITEKVPNLKMPVIVICGRQDPIGLFPAFDIQRLDPRATVYWIERSGHFPWLEEPEAFYEKFFEALK